MKITLSILGIFIMSFAWGQNKDETTIKQIFNKALTEGKSYEILEYLSNKIGGRLSGSPQAAAAVQYMKQVMDTMGFDRVYLQEVMVPHWIRGGKEEGRIVNSSKFGSMEFDVCALGNTVGTGEFGVSGGVVEVKTFDELKQLGKDNIEGKIVFFNRRMDPSRISTFDAYGDAVDQRVFGPSEAAKYGAIAAIVRSMNPSIDDIPHTGVVRYDEKVKKIPAIAISTKDAEQLSKLLKEDKNVQFYVKTTCQLLADELSYNVIAEIKGSQKPDEIVLVGGHLDSWETGDGSHDDGAGCVQSIEVLRLFKKLGIKPKRTLRAVLFMNEENGTKGALKYAEQAKLNKEKHIVAIESDRGGFTPRFFEVEDEAKNVDPLNKWKSLLLPYGIDGFKVGGAGADVEPLKEQGTLVMELSPDSQRYFDVHHTPADTFDRVNQRELEIGGAAIAAIVYLFSEYGIPR